MGLSCIIWDLSLGCTDSVVVVWELLLFGVWDLKFPNQGSNPSSLHCKVDSTGLPGLLHFLIKHNHHLILPNSPRLFWHPFSTTFVLIIYLLKTHTAQNPIPF